MARKQRDYKAEYKRRIQHGLERGYTRSQAAGHPTKGEKSITEIKRTPAPPKEPKKRPYEKKVEGWGGVYSRRNAFGFYGGTFISLDIAFDFAHSLSGNVIFYFAQRGTLIKQSPQPKPGTIFKIGEVRDLSLSTLMDKTHLTARDQKPIRDKSAMWFSKTAPSTFTVFFREG
jgi:hypothetical protein